MILLIIRGLLAERPNVGEARSWRPAKRFDIHVKKRRGKPFCERDRAEKAWDYNVHERVCSALSLYLRELICQASSACLIGLSAIRPVLEKGSLRYLYLVMHWG